MSIYFFTLSFMQIQGINKANNNCRIPHATSVSFGLCVKCKYVPTLRPRWYISSSSTFRWFTTTIRRKILFAKKIIINKIFSPEKTLWGEHTMFVCIKYMIKTSEQIFPLLLLNKKKAKKTNQTSLAKNTHVVKIMLDGRSCFISSIVLSLIMIPEPT